MPKVSDFKKNNLKHESKPSSSSQDSNKTTPSEEQTHVPQERRETVDRPKRRPGREAQAPAEVQATQDEVMVVDVEHGPQKVEPKSDVRGPSAMDPHEELPEVESTRSETPKRPKIEIGFPGSEILRAKFPLPFEVAESVATEWVSDGDFSSVELPQKLATEVLKTGLKRAKNVEKKVLASPVTEKLAMQALTYGMKVQSKIQKPAEFIGKVASVLKPRKK